jgi:hypothetical protein
MNQNRLLEWLGSRQDVRMAQTNLSGFMANPLAGSMTPEQALMYEAAYQQAQQQAERPRWRGLTECLN